MRDAQIVENRGPAVVFQMRSQGQMASTNIQANGGDGIRLLLGSALLPSSFPAGNTVSGNTGMGLICFDSESSVILGPTLAPQNITFSGNTVGSFSCSSFDQPPAFPPPPGPVPGT